MSRHLAEPTPHTRELEAYAVYSRQIIAECLEISRGERSIDEIPSILARGYALRDAMLALV